MITKQRTLYLLLLFLLTLFPLSGCSSGSSPGKQTADETKSDTKTTSRETYTDVCTPQASQTVVYGDKTTSLDASHTKSLFQTRSGSRWAMAENMAAENMEMEIGVRRKG